MSARRLARRMERICCSCATMIPLGFVYGLTTWGVWVMIELGRVNVSSNWIGATSTVIAVALYGLLNWSYTVAVFTNPGSTINNDGYGLLPTTQDGRQVSASSFTVKANGEMRFCKKCQARKPDRAHHCSTCRRCILKMDHHCPWLATCVGLHNQKAFLLFLIYTTLLCLYGFLMSGSWVWAEIIEGDGSNAEALDGLLPINFIMMSVVGGILGLVVGAFTAWHIMLASRGQTTLECLEKIRYSSPLRKAMQQVHDPANRVPQAAQQFVDFHASALPGITRPEEGEERREMPPARGQVPQHMNYQEYEREQSRRRYEEYLDEQDSERLPNAFDLGWKRNLLHLLGPKPMLCFLPICNTTGDGWSWEASSKWLEARERLRIEREAQRRREIDAGWGGDDDDDNHGQAPRPPTSGKGPSARPASKADRVLGREPHLYADGTQNVPMTRLNQRGQTVDELLDEIDGEDLGKSKAGMSRAEAERRAFDTVTNGNGWNGGGASGVLKNGTGRGGHAQKLEGERSLEDEGVD